MVPEDRDAAILLDIVNAVRDIEGFVEGVDFLAFANDKMLRYAVERQLIVVGEAAKGCLIPRNSLHLRFHGLQSSV